jgi:hypothetical protein
MNASTVVICLAAGLAFKSSGQSSDSCAAQPSAQPVTWERSYPVDPNSFFRLMRQAIGEKEIHSDVEVLRIYFKQNQIDLAPPSSVKFSYETRSVVVSATAETLTEVKALLPPPPPPAPVLFIRYFSFGTNDPFALARHALGNPTDQSDLDVLLHFFKDKGAEISRPSTWFYTYGEHILMVRSTKEKLDTIEKLVAELRSGK